MNTHSPSLRTARMTSAALALILGMAGAQSASALGLSVDSALTPPTPGMTPPAGLSTYGKLPVRFEPNVGQAPAAVQYLGRDGAVAVGLTTQGALLNLSQDIANPAKVNSPHSSERPRPMGAPLQLRLRWLHARSRPMLQAEQRQKSVSNYFIGKDPSTWRHDVANYGKVRYEGLYPGIDWVVYGNPGQLEYDLVVAPEADPARIRLKVEGARRLSLDKAGNLVIEAGDRVVAQGRPLLYQDEDDGSRRVISGHYVLDARRSTVAFAVEDYDHRRPLIIDPVLSYSTYLGGSADDYAQAIAVDAGGNAYVAGYTTSSNFPTAGPEQPVSAGGTATDSVCACDAFVAKLSADGGKLVYSTYLGGTQDDYAQAIAIDSSGSAYVAGYTGSTDFPTAGAEQSANAGGSDAFITKLSADGSKLVYSTYLGGTQADVAQGIAVDSSGSAYVAGYTTSTNFPTAPSTASPIPGLPSTSNAEQTANAGGYDAFVAKFSADGSTLTYSTYLGGSGDDYGYGITVDSAGSAYIAGDTTSTDFPTKNPEQSANQDNYDVFVTKLSAAGTALTYSTYLGGFENDHARAIAVDSSGSAYVGGSTVSTNFPTKGPQQVASGGGYDGFLTKFSADGMTLVYSTYLGGSADDYVYGLAVDSSGNCYATGFTASGDFPLVNPLQTAYSGGMYDVFVTELSASGSVLVYSTYLGGGGDDYGYGIARDSSGNEYVAGYTTSTNFPTAGPEQDANAGGNDAFISKIAPSTLGGSTSGGTTGGSSSGGTTDGTSTGGTSSGGSSTGGTSGGTSSGGTSTGSSSGGSTVALTPPVAAFTVTPDSGASPLTVSFDAATSSAFGSDTTILVYTFDFGDGSVLDSSSPTVVHRYGVPGTYAATLNVTDSNGEISRSPATASIIVGAVNLVPGGTGGALDVPVLIGLFGFLVARRRRARGEFDRAGSLERDPGQ